MSRLDKMIAELCSNEVEYKCIGEIANCYPGATPKTSNPEYWENGTIPWMSSGEVNYGEVTFTEKKITQLGYNNTSTKMVPVNSVVIALAGQGKTRGTVAITKIPLCTNQSLCAIVPKDNIISEFLLHFLRSQYQQLRDVSSGDGTRGGLNLKMINAYKVPVPPLTVQSEIVRILDNFSELTSELTAKLTAELTARKKQYEYYMEYLLNSKDDATMEALGEIFFTVTDYVAAGSFASIAENVSYKSEPDYAQLVRTMDIKSSFTKGSNVYVDENAFKFLWRVNLDKESIIMPNIGVNCGEVYFVTPQDLPYDNNVLGPNAILLRSEKYNNKYLFYLLKTNTFQKALKIIISPGGQTKFNKTELKKLKLPIPSLEEQDRIVALLDRFDALYNDISAGLSAEIEARTMQYEYYRNKLLTFKKLS